jgi:pectate lyase
MPKLRPVRDVEQSRASTRQTAPVRRLLFASIAAVGLIVTAVVALAPSASAATLLSDNFEDGNADGWSKSGGAWSIVTDGSRVYRQTNLSSELARAFAGSTSWTNYTVQARVRPLAFDGSGRFVGISARTSGATKFYRLALLNSNRAELQAVNGSSVTVIGGVSRTVSTGTWYTLRIEVSGTTIRGFVDNTQIASGSNSMEDNGRIALQTFHATASFDDVFVSDSTGPGPTSTSTSTSRPPTSTTSRPPTTTTSRPPQPPGGLVGWATQGGGTTGGGSASPITVTSASALSSALSSSSAAVIRISGTISCSGMLSVGSNKSILGISGATIAGCGLNIDEASNVIVRNVNFRDWDDDAINVQYSTRVWIDHNSFTNGFDGAVDVKRASDFVTISWNRFFGHEKTMLLGHSDDNAGEDRGHLRVTYHHNWFDGTNSRHPRVRFGNPVHVYNNYYNNIGDYGVASTMEGCVIVEGNYFENTDDPYHRGEGSSDPGSLVARNNTFVNSGAGDAGGSCAAIPYSFSLESSGNVRGSVTAGAGAGRISV